MIKASGTSKVMYILSHFCIKLNVRHELECFCVGVIGDCELQLETILECCNEAYPRRNLQESPDKSACQSNKRVKLSEPLPCTKSMCQVKFLVTLESC